MVIDTFDISLDFDFMLKVECSNCADKKQPEIIPGS